MTSNIELVNVPDDPEDLNIEGYDQSLDEDPSKRMIKYHLGPDFLELKTVGLTMNFSIGPDAI